MYIYRTYIYIYLVNIYIYSLRLKSPSRSTPPQKMPDGKLLFGRGGLWVNADIRGRMFVFQWLPQFPENPCIYIYIFGIFTETWKVKTGQSLKTNVGKETFPIWILWVFSSFPICPPLIWLKYPRNMVNDKIQLWNNGPGIVKRKFIDKPYHLDTAQVGIDSGNIGNCQLKHKGSDQNPKFKAMVQGSWWITNPNKAQVWFPQHGSHCIIPFTREPLCSKKKTQNGPSWWLQLFNSLVTKKVPRPHPSKVKTTYL